MKIEIIREKLVDAVSRVQLAAGRNSTLPVLAGLHLEAKADTLTIRATNLDLGISSTLSVKTAEEGKVVVPANILNSLLNSLTTEKIVSLTSNGQSLEVRAGSTSAVIKALPLDDFPIIPHVKEDADFSLPIKDLIAGIKATLYAASTGSIKPELSSIYIYHDDTSLIFAATDSFRLAEKRLKLKKSPHFDRILIPQKNAAEIARVLDGIEGEVAISIEENQAALRAGALYITSRTIDGTFPDYKQIIPKEFAAKAVILKQDLITALKTTIIFSDNFNQLKFDVDPSKKCFEIESKNQNVGENTQSVSASLEGKKLSLAVNHRYFTDCLSSIPADSISVSFAGEGRPIVVEGVGDKTFSYLVMPMNR